MYSAAYINCGFNVINRVANGLGVTLPETADLNKSATLLLTIGYRALSGQLVVASTPGGRNPFQPLVEDLRAAALRGPARLPRAMRASLYSSDARGPLGDFGRLIADRAWEITSSDITVLRNAACPEDHIFEATICAALGASSRRLDRLLTAIRETFASP